MKNNKNNVIKSAGVVIVATASTLASASAMDAKQATINSLKQFEANKSAAMQSLIQKISNIEGNNSLLTEVKNIAMSELKNSSASNIEEDTVYLKPQQSHRPTRD